jgi:hypothetical protein
VHRSVEAAPSSTTAAPAAGEATPTAVSATASSPTRTRPSPCRSLRARTLSPLLDRHATTAVGCVRLGNAAVGRRVFGAADEPRRARFTIRTVFRPTSGRARIPLRRVANEPRAALVAVRASVKDAAPSVGVRSGGIADIRLRLDAPAAFQTLFAVLLDAAEVVGAARTRCAARRLAGEIVPLAMTVRSARHPDTARAVDRATRITFPEFGANVPVVLVTFLSRAPPRVRVPGVDIGKDRTDAAERLLPRGDGIAAPPFGTRSGSGIRAQRHLTSAARLANKAVEAPRHRAGRSTHALGAARAPPRRLGIRRRKSAHQLPRALARRSTRAVTTNRRDLRSSLGHSADFVLATIDVRHTRTVVVVASTFRRGAAATDTNDERHHQQKRRVRRQARHDPLVQQVPDHRKRAEFKAPDSRRSGSWHSLARRAFRESRCGRGGSRSAPLCPFADLCRQVALANGEVG